METICKICGRKFATWKGFGYHVHLGHNISCAEYIKNISILPKMSENVLPAASRHHF